jgi:hypothetical protein
VQRNAVGADVKVDTRSEAVYAVKDMTVASSIAYIYPRLVCVSDYQDEVWRGWRSGPSECGQQMLR